MKRTLYYIDALANQTMSSEWIANYSGDSTGFDKYVFTHSLESTSDDDDDILNNTIGFGFGQEWNLSLQTISMSSCQWLEQVHIIVFFSKVFDTDKSENENFQGFADDVETWISTVLMPISNSKASEIRLDEPFEISEYARKIIKMTCSLSVQLPFMAV